MVKEGGESYNTNVGGKTGMRGNYRCSICGRSYRQEWTKDIHERLCKEHKNANK